MIRNRKIVVRGQSARDMIHEINNPIFSKEQLDMFRKALEVSRKIKSKKK